MSDSISERLEKIKASIEEKCRKIDSLTAKYDALKASEAELLLERMSDCMMMKLSMELDSLEYEVAFEKSTNNSVRRMSSWLQSEM